MHIFLVNGPPRSGKDTVGNMIFQLFAGERVDKFARILKERTHALYGLFIDGAPMPHDTFEEGKDTPMDCFLGLSPRQAYIHVSETYMKPVHGDVIFATLLADSWEKESTLGEKMLGGPNEDLFIITDSGFQGEAEELLRLYPEAGVTLIQLQRDDCDFSADSRGYIELWNPNEALEPERIMPIIVVNNGTLTELRVVLATVISERLGVKTKPRFVAEVQVPGADECGNNPQWLEFRSGEDFESMLAGIEAARRSTYSQRVVRILDRMGVDDIDLGERYIYPGDAPVYDLNPQGVKA